ncbi:hypothetical protein ACGC1H_001851 [Rhizoctonia solani]
MIYVLWKPMQERRYPGRTARQQGTVMVERHLGLAIIWTCSALFFPCCISSLPAVISYLFIQLVFRAKHD